MLEQSSYWENAAMTYEAPSFVELRMDAEIGSYQEDFEFEPEEPRFVRSEVCEFAPTSA
jgi:hypothetical protein